jgi:hypothetical protein
MHGIPFRTILQKKTLLRYCSEVKEKTFDNSFLNTQEIRKTYFMPEFRSGLAVPRQMEFRERSSFFRCITKNIQVYSAEFFGKEFSMATLVCARPGLSR